MNNNDTDLGQIERKIMETWGMPEYLVFEREQHVSSAQIFEYLEMMQDALDNSNYDPVAIVEPEDTVETDLTFENESELI